MVKRKRGRPPNTIDTARGKAQLEQKIPHVVKLFFKTIEDASEKKDYPTLMKCFDIFFKKTIPDLSAVEWSVDNGKMMKLLQDLAAARLAPATNMKIPTVETPQIKLLEAENSPLNE